MNFLLLSNISSSTFSLSITIKTFHASQSRVFPTSQCMGSCHSHRRPVWPISGCWGHLSESSHETFLLVTLLILFSLSNKYMSSCFNSLTDFYLAFHRENHILQWLAMEMTSFPISCLEFILCEFVSFTWMWTSQVGRKTLFWIYLY